MHPTLELDASIEMWRGGQSQSVMFKLNWSIKSQPTTSSDDALSFRSFPSTHSLSRSYHHLCVSFCHFVLCFIPSATNILQYA